MSIFISYSYSLRPGHIGYGSSYLETPLHEFETKDGIEDAKIMIGQVIHEQHKQDPIAIIILFWRKLGT